MTSNKNIKIFLIFSITLSLYFIYNTINNSDEKNLQNTPSYSTSNINKTTTISTEKTTFQMPENKPKASILQDSKQPRIDNNISKDLARLIELQELRKKDPTTLLTIDEIPAEQQPIMKEWLSSIQEKGYIISSDAAFDYIELQHNQAGFVNLNDPSIIVSLQNTENTALSKFEYKGAILDQIADTEHLPVLGVKRLYIDPEGNEIILYEKFLADSGALLIKEFISDDVKGYPAMAMTLCTETQRCVSKITFMTQDKSYEISTKGDQDSTKEKLLEIALSLELPELKQIQN